MKVIQYEHHGRLVSVNEELKGKHREMSLCYRCEKFQPEGDKCPIASAVYANCVAYNLVTPVLECPEFTQK